MKLYFEKYLALIKTDPIKFCFNMTVFISSIATIIGLLFIVPQIQLANRQLKELDSRAKIEVDFHGAEATTTLQIGPSVSGPIEFFVVPRNVGDYNTSSWRLAVTFCRDINISNSAPNWILQNSLVNEYIYQSNKLLVTTHELGLFIDTFDSIGSFWIYLPSSKIKQNEIPIAMVFSAGEKTDSKMTLISWNNRNGFYMKDVNTLNGRFIPPQIEKLIFDCRPVIYK